MISENLLQISQDAITDTITINGVEWPRSVFRELPEESTQLLLKITRKGTSVSFEPYLILSPEEPLMRGDLHVRPQATE